MRAFTEAETSALVARAWYLRMSSESGPAQRPTVKELMDEGKSFDQAYEEHSQWDQAFAQVIFDGQMSELSALIKVFADHGISW